MGNRVQAPFVSPGNLDIAAAAAAGTPIFGDMYFDSARTSGPILSGASALCPGGFFVTTGSSVTGDLLTVKDGCQVLGASAWLTNVTSENMKVGDNASALISGITFPVTDLGATNPHMCRAT